MRLSPLVLLALLAPAAAAAPEQVHLGLPTADPSTDMSVHWLEGDPLADATVTVETPDGPVEFVGERVPGPSVGFAYEARLTGLAPGTTYPYAVGGRDFTLTTPRAGAGEFSFVALGDMGLTPAARDAVATIDRLQPDLVLHAGDISYAEGDPTAWASWFDMVEPVAASRPWVTAVGNHEAAVKGVGDEGADANAPNPVEQAFYKQRFGLPGNELWYSFDWQGVHFVALDTFSEARLPAAEVEWLAADLAAASEAAWTIVFLHEPPYSSNAHGSSPRAQDAFVPLFEAHGVDLVLAAHDHGYERFGQLVAGQPVAGGPSDYAADAGPLYVVTGGGGESLYDEWRRPPVKGSVAHSSTHHVTLVRVSPSALFVEYVPTGDADFADAFTITKRATANGAAPAAIVTNAVGGLAPLAVAAAVGAFALLRRRA